MDWLLRYLGLLIIILLVSITSLIGFTLLQPMLDNNGEGTTSISNVTKIATQTITIIKKDTSQNITSTTTNTEFSITTQTSTVTSISTSTTILTSKFITTSTSTITTYATTARIISPTIGLVSIIAGEAASWDKTDLTLLINNETANIGATGIDLIETVGSSLDQWRRSIKGFTENNQQYSYMNRISITVYIQGGNYTLLRGKPDIEISFYNRLPSSLLGETQLLISNSNFIDHAEISVSIRDLSSRGIYNILIHELGHTLGLRHTDEPTDLMFSERDRGEVTEIILCPSTLDLYALSLIYQWIEGEEYYPYPNDSVTLPENEIYKVVACST